MSETATKHAHDLFEKWPQLRDLSLNALTAELAAAEERGRRAGIEQAAQEVESYRAVAAFGGARTLIRELVARLRTLAPRDSGHEAGVLTDDNATRITAPKDRK